jgi:hypothetical protein
MRVYLTNGITGDRLTAADMQTFIERNLVVSFGNNEMSYSPACMIRVARLFANKGNELLEEINFSNVLTQTIMHQLCNDFETLESNNLLTGSTSQIGHGSSLPASLSAFINNPTEVHIYLRDLFGVCRHSNFELAATDGLNLTLELEDKQSLFRVSTLGDFQQINVADISGNVAGAVLPQYFTVDPSANGYFQNVSSMSQTPTKSDQFDAPSSGLFVDASGNSMIQYPKEGFWFGANQWFEQPTIASSISTLVFQDAYTTNQLTALGMVAGAFLKLRYSVSSSFTGGVNVAPKMFVFMVKILSAAGGAAGAAVVTFTTNFALWWDAVGNRTVNTDVVFEGAELLRSDEVMVKTITASAADILIALKTNILTLTDAEYEELQALGLIDNQNVPTAATFDLGVQLQGAIPATASTGSHIVPDVITNELSPFVRKIYSNQLTKLPTQGAKCRINDVVKVANANVISFTTWGCEAGTSIQPYTSYLDENGAVVTVPATAISYFIWNVQNHARGPNDVGTDASGNYIPYTLNNLSYEIDKFELVLIQSTIDPKNRMSSPFIYSTWKLEVATVETAQPTYARQFILEENVYNCMLLTPNWNAVGTDKGSLVSTRRGVSHFRYSVNQVNQTNRDVYLSSFRSFYPSTLYIDRLTDTFSNSDYILRSPVGIKGVHEAANSVLIYPLKIYHAVSEQEYKMGSPGGGTVQINLFSDTSMGTKIQAGNIFFFKQVLKQLM